MRIIHSVATQLLGLMALLTALPALSQNTAPLGGKGGVGYELQCPRYAYLVGFRTTIGRDMDGVSAVCAPLGESGARGALSPALAFAGTLTTNAVVEHLCPDARRAPFVRRLEVHAEGDETFIVNGIRFWCGTANGPATSAAIRAAGPNERHKSSRLAFEGVNNVDSYDTVSCPDGQAAAGIHGNAGLFVDSLGLVCRGVEVQPRSEMTVADQAGTTPGGGADIARDAARAVAPGTRISRSTISETAAPTATSGAVAVAGLPPRLVAPAQPSGGLPGGLAAAAAPASECATGQPGGVAFRYDVESRLARIRCEQPKLAMADQIKLAQRLDEVIMWISRQPR